MIQDAPTIDAPYPGLRSFEPHEAAIFFGRGSHTATMLRLLGQQNFLAVVGSSGSGKSSLVRAGLLPALADGYLNGQIDWRFVIVRPGEVVGSGVNTFGNLAAQLVSTLQPELLPLESESASEMLAYREATLRMGPNGLLDAIHDSLTQDDSKHVFVLVDQFEEIFRYRDDSLSRNQQRKQHNDAVAFVDLLLSSAQARDPRVCVSLTMRSDFLGNCDAFHGLPQAINVGQFLPPRLTRDELRDVIELPLQTEPFRGTINPQITAALLNDISDSQDLLPLLQHVLRRMWTMAAPDGEADGQTPHHITLDHFRDIGGLSHALDRHANDLYKSLTTEQQPIVQRLFRCLSERSPQGQLTRRLTSVQEVADIAGVRPEEVNEVVDVFRRPGVHFLVTSTAGALTAATHIDISHESLLRQWKLLQQWIEEESEAASGYRRLIDAVKQGEKVIDGIRLDRFVEWHDNVKPTAAWARRYDGLVEEENDLLAQCLQLIDDSLDAREAQQQAAERERLKREQAQARELELAQNLADAQTARAATFRRMLIAAALATAVAVAFAVVALYARRETTKAIANLAVE